jgi:DNA-directed RNA polymerase subunit RPC12/RpoP
MAISACPNCESARLYKTKRPVSSGGGYAPDLLPGLGRFWSSEKLDVVVCQDCGLMRLFARTEARARLQSSPKWQRT